MVTDHVCGTEIEEIDVPDSLRLKREGKIYYFCSARVQERVRIVCDWCSAVKRPDEVCILGRAVFYR